MSIAPFQSPTSSPGFYASTRDPNSPRGARILGIKLRLEPPRNIRSFADAGAIIWNHEFLRLLLAIVIFLIFAYTVLFIQQWSDRRWWWESQSVAPLRDLGFDAIPFLSNSWIVNFFISMTVGLSAVGLLVSAPDWTSRLVLLRRFCWCSAILYAFRAVTISVTTLPSPLPGCTPPLEVVYNNATVGERFWIATQTILGLTQSCTDNIFSGHTANFVALSILWKVHSSWNPLFGIIIYAFAAGGAISLIATRYHYTIDVILGAFITYNIYNIYLHLVNKGVEKVIFGEKRVRDRFIKRGNGKSEMAEEDRFYQYVAFMPREMAGTKLLVTVISFMDGLDIRFKSLEEEGSIEPIVGMRVDAREEGVFEAQGQREITANGRRDGVPLEDIAVAK